MSTQMPNLGYTPAPPDRRTQRAQRRAARDQARLGRDQARMQKRMLQHRSVSGPVLLIAVGITLLLLQTGRLRWNDVLTWLSLWWPAILIATGAVMILEWVLDHQRSATQGGLPPRRILGGAATALLLLVAAAGAGLTFARHNASFFRDALNAPWIGNGRNSGSPFFGVHREFTSDLRATLAPDGELTVENPRGDVTVTGSSQDGQVHISVHQHLFTEGGEDLNARHTREQPQIHGDRDHLTLTTRPEEQDDADLVIQLPHNASLIVHSGHGDVSVEELHRTTTIAAADGDVKLTALRGAVHVDTQDDDSTITAHSLGGGLTLNGRSGDINLSDIDGGLAIRGDFFGTTQMERIRGNISFQSSFTHFTCAGIPGNLAIEGRSDLTAKQVQGPLVLATTDRNLALNDVRGAATITDRNGSVTLTLMAPLQPLHVTDANGTVNLSIPDHQPFTLHATAKDAEIRNDFNLSSTKQGSTTVTAGGVLGGGPELELETTNDDIEIHKATPGDTGSSTEPASTGLASPGSARMTHRFR